MYWTPNEEEKKYLELIIGMSSDCLCSNGTVDLQTYIKNLKTIVNLLEDGELEYECKKNVKK